MKNIIRILTLALVLVGVPAVTAPMTGCAAFQSSHPTQTVRDVGGTYLAVVNTLNSARRSGMIDYDTWHHKVNPVIQEGRSIYRTMKLAATEGNADQVEVLELALEAVVARLNAIAMEVN